MTPSSLVLASSPGLAARRQPRPSLRPRRAPMADSPALVAAKAR
jgi:hypothetical protein